MSSHIRIGDEVDVDAGRGVRLVRMTALLAVGLAVPLLPTTGATAASGQIIVTSVSNPRPQLVSGGDVLVRVTVPSGVSLTAVTVAAGGRAVRSRFVAQPDGTLLGLVTGLPDGSTTITAKAGTAARAGTVVVDNHPSTGPVFSGPQQHPYACQTTAFGLAQAVQPYCAAPSQVVYGYYTTAGQFAPLADRSSRPSDLATATVNGRVVPYIVRLERGTIDRAVYEVAALDDGADPAPTRRDGSLNRALVYTFGGGCNGGFHQGIATGGVLDDRFLRSGYVVASSTLNVLANSCSTVISAEAAMMVKEHVVETFGPMRHTIGWGGSGGAIQQYAIADAYPGILDGIIPGISFPDIATVLPVVADCKLLQTYFASGAASASSFTPAQQTAVSGFTDISSCASWTATFANRATPTDSCDGAVPVSVRYDPTTNPDGVKCSLFEQVVNQVGRNPTTRLARSWLDNRGVQYGLAALEAGTITAQQFVDLNAFIGGLDVAGRPAPQRSVASPAALAAVYRTDLVNSASLGLATTPVIDQRTDLDGVPGGADIHTTEWSYVMRHRLIEANGNAANQVILETGYDGASTTAAADYELGAMERWLTAVDRSHATTATKTAAAVAAARPSDLMDGCYPSAGQRLRQTLTYPATGDCGAAFPVAANPRLVAGEGLGLTVLACRLRPIDEASYSVTFSPAQLQQLKVAFPSGVCDRARDGQAQQSPIGAWLGYGDESSGLTPPTPL